MPKKPKLFPRAHVQTLLPSHTTVFREHPYIQKKKITSQLFQHVNKDSLIKTVFFLFVCFGLAEGEKIKLMTFLVNRFKKRGVVGEGGRVM